MAVQFGVFWNGASDLQPTRTGSGRMVNGGTLAETHEAAQRSMVAAVRQGILAEHLGYEYFWLTEHHFQPEGIEDSPNPLLTQVAVAAHTKRIRLAQCANIISWHHPIRIAEQAAMLDVISGGRLEFGIGRGYQPREAEVFGWPYGSTIQDDERNRQYHQEAYDIIMKAWSEDSISHHGQFFTIPPNYTRWNNQQTIAYFDRPGVGRELEQVLKLGGPAFGPNPVQATTTTLKEISVYPHPLQKPHPQVWEPISSSRSVDWVAGHGLNGFLIVEPNSRAKKLIEAYYEAAERHGWPDMLNRGRFKFGWDAQRKRGMGVVRHLHIADKGIGDLERADRAMEVGWHYYGAFGFASLLAEADEDLLPADFLPDGPWLRKKEIMLHGTKDYIIEGIMRLYNTVGFEDFLFVPWFDLGGFSTAETEEQMQCFAEEIMPVLRRELGEGPAMPEVGVDLNAFSVPV